LQIHTIIITIRGADMKGNTIAFTGFSRDDEVTAISTFNSVNERLAGAWLLQKENDAELVVIDMDTVYGYMTWLKAQSAGKKTAAVTTADRSDAEYLLPRPLKADDLFTLLSNLSIETPTAIATPVAAITPKASTETITKAIVEAPPTPPAVAISPADAIARVTGQHVAMPALQAHANGARKLFHFLKPGGLKGPVKLQIAGAPDLIIDVDQQIYLGGNLLKPLLPYASTELKQDDFQALTDTELQQHKAAAVSAQPLSRLNWLAHLAGHAGELMNGALRNGEFHLSKWPVSEREFPKHFRIATVMIKGPAKLGDIATQSGATLHEVIDFVNANIATGHISL
jgi:hypothetical protein